MLEPVQSQRVMSASSEVIGTCVARCAGMRILIGAFLVLFAVPEKIEGAPRCSNATACRHACDGGDQTACVDLARLLQAGTGIAKDPAAAHRLFVAACDRGDRVGCLQAGLDLSDGTGVLKDSAAGAKLVAKSCEAGLARIMRDG